MRALQEDLCNNGAFIHMTRLSRLVLLTLIVFVIAVAAYVAFLLRGPGQSPSGQPPLANLSPTNSASLVKAFNDAAGQVRAIVLISPT
jgi:hypothetical protein